MIHVPPVVELVHGSLVRGRAVVLRDVSLVIHASGHTAILGPNGAGKTSLIRMLTLDDRPLRGDGTPALRLFGREQWDVEELRRRLGVVTGDLDSTFGFGTSRGRVCGEDVALSGFFGSQGVFSHHEVTGMMRQQARRALERVDAGHLAARPLSEMSTGERRRVLIARALVTSPDALVLDEPTAGLDLVARHRFMQSVSALARQGTTVILVTHHVDEIIPEVTQVAMLREGQMLFAGPRDEALTAPRLSALFGAPLGVDRSGDYVHVRLLSPSPPPVGGGRPFGTWPSPITASSVAAQGLRLGSVAVDGDWIAWLEGRPAEGGRNVLVVRSPDGVIRDVTPAPFNVRTRVHEYGGGAFVAGEGVAWFSNFADQRLYRVPLDGSALPVPITPEASWFYADATLDRGRRRLIAVREDHSDASREPSSAIVAVPLPDAPGAAGVPGEQTLLVSGRDFYSTPRLSPDGRQLAWLCWDHPQMPWDGTELWVGDVSSSGSIERPRLVAGGVSESIYQPGWLADGGLLFASDRSGWWQLYRVAARVDAGMPVVPVLTVPPAESEFGRPQWNFGTQTWVPAGHGRLAVSFHQRGRWRLGFADLASGTLEEWDRSLEPADWLAATGFHLVFMAASPATARALVRLDLRGGALELLRSSSSASMPERYLSLPDAIQFPTAHGRIAHAFYYPPANADVEPAAGELPPLIAISHGGPTDCASSTLDMRIQFWTSRGFAVVDVNYAGSNGYGREYRELLRGAWGIADVDDMVAAVQYLVAQGRADRNRLIIRGGSAGGYTTLAALTGHPEVFRAGASYYGVADIEVLARDTHKFESRYLDSLVGPYPEMRDEYRRRSPIHAVERLSCPLILFQGADDKVVPPNQSSMMADAVRRKGLPVAYLIFEGEQHGFRRAETIVRSLEAELYFYGAVFGFEPADTMLPVAIDNLHPPRGVR